MVHMVLVNFELGDSSRAGQYESTSVAFLGKVGIRQTLAKSLCAVMIFYIPRHVSMDSALVFRNDRYIISTLF